MAWGVFAPASGYHHGALAGTYVGGSGSASLGVGLGANALIGGSHRSIALQPLSVEGQVGINLALGVAGLSLRDRRAPGDRRRNLNFNLSCIRRVPLA